MFCQKFFARHCQERRQTIMFSKNTFRVEQDNFTIIEERFANPYMKMFPLGNDSSVYFNPLLSALGAVLNAVLLYWLFRSLSVRFPDGSFSSLWMPCIILLFSVVGILFFGYCGIYAPIRYSIWVVMYRRAHKVGSVSRTRIRVKDDFVRVSFTTRKGRTHACYLSPSSSVLFQDIALPTLYLNNHVLILPSHLRDHYFAKLLDEAFPDEE